MLNAGMQISAEHKWHTSECRQLLRNGEKGDGNFAKRMLLGKFEVTLVVIQCAENTGNTLYRYMIQAIYNTGDT
jgi:hypothetical protein